MKGGFKMRKRRAVKRDILPDPIYNSKIVAKLINTVMLDGKKGIAQSIVYEAFNTVKDKTGKDALETFNEVYALTPIFSSLLIRRIEILSSKRLYP